MVHIRSEQGAAGASSSHRLIITVETCQMINSFQRFNLRVWAGKKIHLQFSVGSNPNIMNFELLWTWQAELWTQSNPGLFSKIELQRLLSNTSKKPKFRTCSARNGLNLGLNLDQPNFEPFQTQVCQTKLNYELTQTLQKSWTHELDSTQHYFRYLSPNSKRSSNYDWTRPF